MKKTLSLAALAAFTLFKVSPAQAGNNLTITAGADTNVTAGPAFTTTEDGAFLQPDTITGLWSLGDVSVATATGGANTEAGNISIQQAIDTTTAFDLLIQATNNLFVTAGGIASHGAGGISLEGGGAATVTPALETAGGAVAVSAAGAGGLTIGGNITTLDAGVAGGDITLTALAGGVSVTGSMISTGAILFVGNGGNITMNATGAITTSATTLIRASSFAADGGTAALHSTGAGVALNHVDTSTWNGFGNAGAVTLTAGGTGATGIQVGQLQAFSNEGHGGTATLTSHGTAGITVTHQIDTRSYGGGGGDIILAASAGAVYITGTANGSGLLTSILGSSGTAGSITIEASGAIAVTRIDASDAGYLQSSNGGTVQLHSSGAGIEVSSVSTGSGMDGKDAGAVTLNAAGVGSSGLTVQNVDAYAYNGLGGTVNLTSNGTAGITVGDIATSSYKQSGADITITASTGPVAMAYGFYALYTSGADHPSSSGSSGKITIEAAGTVTIPANRSLITSSTYGHGGDVSVTSQAVGGISIGTINTLGLLSSGDVILDAPSVSVGNIITGTSLIEISAQDVTLGDVQADGTLSIHPQIGETSMQLEVTGEITGDVVLDFDFGSGGSFTVASGATLGGSGMIEGDTTIFGTLAPGNSPGTITFIGDVDISAAEEFVFELGMPTSDRVILNAGQLDIGSLGLDDFTFFEADGFVGGEYVLFDTNNAIFGALDPGQFSGTVFGYAAELRLTDSGRDITLAIAPEPTGGALLTIGLGLVLGNRLRRAEPGR